ncbi:PAS domain-containing sensor histidine kinase [Zobellia uliginosa]|uniref:PAS domain-containing sensor histidine kinase n=1 Tax=Zobellia uliginosa TaxID=143224 RepID=UPI001C076E29|nr:PAS domain-containing protein [Zobellia uliginosa]MBU2947261.1 PAS domain-containing protein [Zobellia uliginosa]
MNGTKTTLNNPLVKQLPTATVFTNKKFEVIYASDKFFSDFSFDTNKTFGKPINELFTTISEDWEKKLYNYLSDETHEGNINYSLNSASGSKWYKWTCAAWQNETNETIGLIIHFEDITEKKLKDEETDQLQSLLDAMCMISKIGVWDYDMINDKLVCCDVVREIYGVSKDYEFSFDNAIASYKDGYSRNTISMQVHETMSKGKTWDEKLQFTTAKGEEVWVQVAGMPTYLDGKIVGVKGILQNIEKQVQTENKTKENELLLRTLIDNLPLNVFIKDTESRKILVNKSECDYMGVDSPDDLLGKSDFDLFHEEIASISRAEDLHVMETLIPMLGKETINITKDGRQATFLTSKIPLTGNNGKAQGLVGISMDISDLKQKEQELRDLINVTSQQNKKLVNFAHIVSHNLRSHTANFSMLLDFLTNEKNEEEKIQIVKMLTQASDNLLETLENLNEVVAINSNVNLERKPIRLNQRIVSVKRNLKEFLVNNNAKIVNSISEHTTVKVIPSYIDSILMNFITNAVKYRHPDRQPIINLSATSENGFIVLSIEDNGLGIDLKKYGEKLFGMYKTFHDHSDSRGIGLYITKNQIEAMNGKVTVASEVGLGTTFKIYFNEQN